MISDCRYLSCSCSCVAVTVLSSWEGNRASPEFQKKWLSSGHGKFEALMGMPVHREKGAESHLQNWLVFTLPEISAVLCVMWIAMRFLDLERSNESCMSESLQRGNADLEFNGKRHVLVKVAGCPCPFSSLLQDPWVPAGLTLIIHGYTVPWQTDRRCFRQNWPSSRLVGTSAGRGRV